MMERQQQKHDPKTQTDYVGRVVMTDQQLETLRKQIAVYGIISKQLFETYKTLTATSQPQQHLTLVTSGKTTMLSTSGGGAKSKRPRWNPTTTQLHILESIFSKASGLPSKQKIREIAAELSAHGHVSETNVYNWFQNKRARSKRKPPLQTTTTTTAVLSPNTKGDSDDDHESSEASKSKNDGDNNNTDDHGGKPIMKIYGSLDNETLMSPPPPESEVPSCRIEDLSHEINAELLHFINSRPPEVDSIFSNSSGGK